MPPAVIAFATAFLMASDVTVAPLTASTARLCASTIALGSASTAFVPMPSVSVWFTTRTLKI